MKIRMKLNILEDCKSLFYKVYKVTKTNKFTITPQRFCILRSCCSIGSNIAEGNERIGKDRNHFFNIALGSLEECRFQLSLYEKYNGECEELMNKIRGVVFKLKNPSQSLSQSQSISKGD